MSQPEVEEILGERKDAAGSPISMGVSIGSRVMVRGLVYLDVFLSPVHMEFELDF